MKLTGKELKAKLSELQETHPEYTREERAQACGYIRQTKTGRVKIEMIDFLTACLESDSDIPFKPKVDGRGRKAASQIKVSNRGTAVLASSFVEAIGGKAGSILEVKKTRKSLVITLKAIDPEEITEDSEMLIRTEETSNNPASPFSI